MLYYPENRIEYIFKHIFNFLPIFHFMRYSLWNKIKGFFAINSSTQHIWDFVQNLWYLEIIIFRILTEIFKILTKTFEILTKTCDI